MAVRKLAFAKVDIAQALGGLKAKFGTSSQQIGSIFVK